MAQRSERWGYPRAPAGPETFCARRAHDGRAGVVDSDHMARVIGEWSALDPSALSQRDIASGSIGRWMARAIGRCSEFECFSKVQKV